jgi:hypothetical protein
MFLTRTLYLTSLIGLLHLIYFNLKSDLMFKIHDEVTHHFKI